MVLETCKTYSAGYGDAGIQGMVATATTLCAKKETVPASCAIKTINDYAEDDECYNYWKIGGALQWSEHVNLPEVPSAQYADFIYTSPSNQRIEGFPSTCFDIFGDHVFSDVCYDTSSGFFPDTQAGAATTDNPMPCKGLTQTTNADGSAGESERGAKRRAEKAPVLDNDEYFRTQRRFS